MSPLAPQIYKNPLWIKTQTATIISASSLSFLTVWLTSKGVDEKTVLASLAMLYGLTFIPLLIKSSNVIAKISLAISSALILTSTLGVVPIAIAMCCFIAATQLSRDLFYIGMMDVYGALAEKNNDDVRKVIGMAMLLGIISTIIANPAIGFISSINPELYFALLGFIGLIIVCSIQNESSSQGIENIELSTRVEGYIHWLCSLSFLANMSVFFIRYLLIPIMIIDFGEKLGFSNQVLVITGILISLMAALGFIFNSKPNPESYRSHMYTGLLSTLAACVALSATSIMNLGLDTKYSVLLFLGLYASLEISSKIWTVNFVAQLREQSSFSKDREKCYKAFAKYKAAGGAFGYAGAYLIYDHLSVDWIGLALSSVSVLCCILIMIFKKDKAMPPARLNKA